MLSAAKIKLILSSAALVAFAGAGYALHQWGYAKGVSNERELQAQAVLKWQEQTTKIIQELEVAQNKRQEVLRETVEVIRYVEDPTNCFDARLPDAVLERLHPDYSSSR